jgi:hypothetical protein
MQYWYWYRIHELTITPLKSILPMNRHHFSSSEHRSLLA